MARIIHRERRPIDSFVIYISGCGYARSEPTAIPHPTRRDGPRADLRHAPDRPEIHWNNDRMRGPGGPVKGAAPEPGSPAENGGG